jgi:DNA repair exonuclease SbcCD ATPase subunit
MDLDEIVDELYGLPAEEFTAARNAAAKQAKADGEAELSDKVKALGKPTAAAWLANQLARERAEALESLAMLGEQMREATAAMDGARLRELTPRRHDEVDSLVREAGKLSGKKVSTDVAQKLRETLDAALVDPAAAQAVRSGQLTSALRHVGFGVVDESGEPTNVVQLAPRRVVKKAAEKAAKPKKSAAAERAEAKRLAEAEEAAAEAEANLDAAEARVNDLKTSRQDLVDAMDQARADIDRLTAELEQAKQAFEKAKADRKQVESDLKSAEREQRVADRRSQTATATLDELR